MGLHLSSVGMRRAVCLALLLSSTAWADGGAGQAAPGRGKVHTVLIEGVQFSPMKLEVRPGDTVVWKNQDPFPHTVTAEGRQFDSGSLAPQKSWTYVARKSGSYPYFCTLHTTMKGVLIVK